MKKKLISAALAFAMFLPTTANCADLSTWAIEPYKQASSAGLISYAVASSNLTDSITREEFCDLSVKLYEKITDSTVETPEILPFDDSDSIAVAKAYTIGIVSGNEKGEFCPDNLVTRQEMAKILVSSLDLCGIDMTVYDNEKAKIAAFSDYGNVSNWAQDYVAKAMKYGIINGTSSTTIDPLGNATREQAIAMSNRAYSSFANYQVTEKTPEITAPKQSELLSGSINLRWTAVADANSYYVIVKNSDCIPIIQQTTAKTSYTIKPKQLDGSKNYTVIIGAKTDNGEYFSTPLDFAVTVKSVSTPSPTKEPTPKPVVSSSPTAEPTVTPTDTPAPTKAPEVTPSPAPSADTSTDDAELSVFEKELALAATAVTPAPIPLSEKEQRVFPEGNRFESSEIAEQYMTEIEVPVWLIKNGEKVSSTKFITVNSALADDTKAIFEEIYALPQKYPIKSVGGYCWRNTSSGRLSQHSFGTCIDINPNENYYVSVKGNIYSGSYWKPNEDPYSIAPGDGIIEIFAKYGWAWGGNAWPGSRDYMHFTYLGN